MIVYGRNAVREALRGTRRVKRVWASRSTGEWLGAARAEGGSPPLETASPPQLTAICGSADHQGVCAEADEFAYADDGGLLEPADALVVCLDQVQDPHNLGAVCRVAECAGATGVVIPERRSAQVTAAVCRASAGAVEHLAVARTGNLARFLERAGRAGAWSYGASAAARVAWDEPDYSGRVVLVLGSEGRGLRPRVAGACDELIALPVRGRVSSLNVATAASALVYGILHLRAAG